MSESTTRLVRSSALWSLYGLLGLFAFVENMIGPAVPFLRLEFNLDYSTAAMHMSAFALGQMISGLIATFVIARFGLRRVLWGGMIGILIGITGLVLAPMPVVSLASIFFMSLTGTLALSCLQASISLLGGERRGQALMEANIAASVTSAAAPFILVAGVALGLGWRALWPAFALGLAAATAIGYRPIARELPEIGGGISRTKGALPASFWRPCVLIFFGVGVEWSVGFWATEYLKGLPGHSVSLAAAGAGVFQIAAVCGRFASSRLMARLKERKILLMAMAITLIGFPLYWMRSGPVTAFLGLALCGMGVSTFYPLSLALCIGASGGKTAAASSFAAFTSGAAIFAMPLLLGLIADRSGLPAALWSIPIGLGVMALLTVGRERRSPRQAQ
jgi:fucose permease